MKKYELTFSQVVFLMRVPESSMGCHDVVLMDSVSEIPLNL